MYKLRENVSGAGGGEGALRQDATARRCIKSRATAKYRFMQAPQIRSECRESDNDSVEVKGADRNPWWYLPSEVEFLVEQL